MKCNAAGVHLSVCIPTFNFGHLIGETLDSIVSQMTDDVEIVVLDGASTDNTALVMDEWQRKEPRIRYIRQMERGGIDADVAASIDAAYGEYCWIFSADDLMLPGAISSVLALIDGSPDVCLLRHADCLYDMSIIHAAHPVLAGPSKIYNLNRGGDWQTYLDAALSSEALFSFMSGVVVRRECWGPERPNAGFFYGSCWGIAARLLTIIRDEGLVVSYYQPPVMLRRGENDSFRDAGAVKRFSLAIDGYQSIVTALFGASSMESNQLRRILGAEFGLFAFLDCKAACYRSPHLESRRELDRMVDNLYQSTPADRAKRFIYRSFPAPLLGPAMTLKRWLRRQSARRAL